ncbi:flagellar FlbD family protein [Nocardioides solisilvae]|uniref:flagellar FlbD family protein n=1 Tax=Nocardioides solisilvae TaxID=1542435 RepID=UPI001EF5BD02|nr:flagellar FlbD family protein [Nocardioides solisilvae]
MLTRLSGTQFVLNSDLIERIDATPDTVITLTDGTKYVVADSMTQVVAAVRGFRSEIVALSAMVPPDLEQLFPTPHTAHLAPVTSLPGREAAAERRES